MRRVFLRRRLRAAVVTAAAATALVLAACDDDGGAGGVPDAGAAADAVPARAPTFSEVHTWDEAVEVSDEASTRQVAAAAIAGGYFMAWESRPQFGEGPFRNGVVARRLASDGTFIDDTPIIVADSVARGPGAACQGTTCLVAWLGIQGLKTRLIVDGIPGPEATLLPMLAAEPVIQVRATAGGFVVSWNGAEGATTRHVDLSGAPDPEAANTVLGLSGNRFGTVCVPAGCVYSTFAFDAASETMLLHTVLQASDGTVGPVVTSPTEPADSIALASDGERIVAFTPTTMFFIDVATLAAQPAVPIGPAPAFHESRLAAGHDGSAWILARGDGSVLRLDDQGNQLAPIFDTPGTHGAGSNDDGPAAVACADGQCLVADSMQPVGYPSNVLAVRFDASGPLDTDGLVASTSANAQYGPAAIAIDDGFLLFWRDRRTLGIPELRALRLDAAGEPIWSESQSLANLPPQAPDGPVVVRAVSRGDSLILGVGSRLLQMRASDFAVESIVDDAGVYELACTPAACVATTLTGALWLWTLNSLAPFSPPTIAFSGATASGVARGDGVLIVAWSDAAGMHAATFDDAGPPALLVLEHTVAADAFGATCVALAPRAGGFVALWSVAGALWARTLDDTGAPDGPLVSLGQSGGDLDTSVGCRLTDLGPRFAADLAFVGGDAGISTVVLADPPALVAPMVLPVGDVFGPVGYVVQAVSAADGRTLLMWSSYDDAFRAQRLRWIVVDP